MKGQTQKIALAVVLVVVLIMTGCMGGGTEKTFKLTVTVLDKETNTPLPGAIVRIAGEVTEEKTTNAQGIAVFQNLSGTFELMVQAANYSDQIVTNLVLNQNREVPILLEPMGNEEPLPGTLSGEIVDKENGEKILQAVEVKLDSGEVQVVENGEFLLTELTPGTTTLTATSAGYKLYSTTVEINAGADTEVQIELEKEALGYGGLKGQFIHSISEEPLSGAGIQVFLNGVEGVVEGTGYHFDNFPEGIWSLEVVAPDYEEQAPINIQIIAEKTRTYHIKLHPRIIPPFPPQEVLVPYIAEYPTGDGGIAKIDSFYMSIYTVTTGLAREVYDWAVSEERGEKQYRFAREPFGYIPDEKLWQPITMHWRDAIVWCNALTEYSNVIANTNLGCVYTFEQEIIRDSREENALACDSCTIEEADGYRLPTVLEWEAAARYQNGQNWTPRDHASGDLTSYCSPSNDAGTSTEFGDYAWYAGNASSAHPVGERKPNHLGIYDMSGNVWELCSDRAESDNAKRVCKGGSAWRHDVHIGAAMEVVTTYRMPEIGFRIVRTY